MKSRKNTLLAVTALAILGLCSPRDASAFCGFYVGGAGTKLFNDATQVVMMREGTRTVLSMQNDYKGPPEKFAMVVPVPVVLQKADVKTLPRDVFDRVDQLAAPRLVEYWEQDPCMHERMDSEMDDKPAPVPAAAKADAPKDEGFGVTVEAQFKVGEYEIVILSAKDSSGLDAWLKLEKYVIPDGSEPYLRPYVAAGSKFFVARVDPTKVKFEDGRAALSPLRFHYDSEKFTLPIRLGLVSSSGTQDLIVHILAKQRYEAANYANVTIPTNFDVSEAARDEFGSFYAALFDKTVEKTPKSVVTEYAWGATSCDPCPGGSYGLSAGDLMTLGADALPSSNPPKMAGPAPAAPSPAQNPKRQVLPFGRARRMILTRLHARYSKETLGEDLVFKEASAISGGREVRSPDGTLEHGSSSAPVDNFQARYAIRHPWSGPVTCKEPRRNIWGGPPSGHQGSTAPRAAMKTAFAPRDKIKLEAVVMKDIAEIGVKASGAAIVSGVMPEGAPSVAPSSSPSGASPEAKKSCGACAIGAVDAGKYGIGSGVVFSLGLLLRRRSRRGQGTRP